MVVGEERIDFASSKWAAAVNDLCGCAGGTDGGEDACAAYVCRFLISSR